MSSHHITAKCEEIWQQQKNVENDSPPIRICYWYLYCISPERTDSDMAHHLLSDATDCGQPKVMSTKPPAVPVRETNAYFQSLPLYIWAMLLMSFIWRSMFVKYYFTQACQVTRVIRLHTGIKTAVVTKNGAIPVQPWTEIHNEILPQLIDRHVQRVLKATSCSCNICIRVEWFCFASKLRGYLHI